MSPSISHIFYTNFCTISISRYTSGHKCSASIHILKTELVVSTSGYITWSFNTSIVVWVDADVLLLGAEGELTAVQGLQLVVRL